MDGNQPKRLKVDLLSAFEISRKNVAESVMKFKFNQKRVRIVNNVEKVKAHSQGIVYWMLRDVRVQDNWALLFAQRLALKNRLPLHICFCLPPKFLHSTLRHYKFLVNGLIDVEAQCKKLNINFHLLHGNPSAKILRFVEEYNMGAVVTDFLPLRLPMSWLNNLAENLPSKVALCQVDAHNIIPCWHLSQKQEYAARTIRPKVHANLPTFLTEFPPVIQHAYSTKFKFEANDWNGLWNHVKVDASVGEISWAQSGYRNGIKQLENFLNNRLEKYATERNNPLQNGISDLSPWLHFGIISVQRCILAVNQYKKFYSDSVLAFIEEAIVRRELSDNYCFYNDKYDSLDGTSAWAIETLKKHRKDQRKYIYSLSELENAQMHDDLWNACQNQLVHHGKLHGYLRMYWAKKILEYTENPEKALEYALYLNDRYSLDGTDPNGYVGCMWSICGLHDQGWAEREIFGKIRYMNYEGCKKKFDVAGFVAKWGKVNDIGEELQSHSCKDNPET